jgi:hypothetical protein
MFWLVLCLAGRESGAFAQSLPLPPRAADAPGGRQFAETISPLPAPPDPQREALIYAQLAAGNTPDWMRKLVRVETNAVIAGVNHSVSYFVTPDYLAIGSDDDYFLTPMTPLLAQRVCQMLDCSLPTRRMADAIWAQARVKLEPSPIPPSAAMVTPAVFERHNAMVWKQRCAALADAPLGALVAGDKKDVVISSRIYTNFIRTSRPVVIYGWHHTNGVPIQPLYNGHGENYADYSHGVRLVQQAITVDGAATTVAAVLTNPALAALLSDETNYPGNVIPKPYYPALSLPAAQDGEGLVYEGGAGPGRGKRIVFLAGDEEYRSEEGLPMLAKILAARHGFKCTVLFSINPADGTIAPDAQTNQPGLQALDSADLCVMLLRFRQWPDEQMKHFVDYLNAGRPIIALRTSTHAFAYDTNRPGGYVKYDYRNRDWPGGFGRQVLGETWVSHHGDHGKESTRGLLNPAMTRHPILRGVADLWGPSDVYTVVDLPKDAYRFENASRAVNLANNVQVLVFGQVLSGMKPDDPPVPGEKNNPLMPVVWLRNYTGESGQTSKIVTTTLGAAVDLQNEGLRRLLVNACYWAVGLEDKIPARADVTYVGDYKPSWFGTGQFKKGVKPEDLRMKPEAPAQ